MLPSVCMCVQARAAEAGTPLTTPAPPQVVTRTDNAPTQLNTTGSFSFRSPRPGNFTPSVDATNASGIAVACATPVCSPSSIAAPNATVVCTYSCSPGAWSVQPRMVLDGVTFSGIRRNATLANTDDTATPCANISAPLFTAHAGANWTEPWARCSTGTRSIITAVPPPTAVGCAAFTNYSVTAVVTVRQGGAPGSQLAVANASTAYACPLPSVAGTAALTQTSSFSWCAARAGRGHVSGGG